MNFGDWYTDLMDIKRNVKSVSSNVTRMEPAYIARGVRCRVYMDSGGTPSMQQTSAQISQNYKVACDNSVDICPGDIVIVKIGGRLGQSRETLQAHAGAPHHYYEPFGAVVPQLAHQEFSLLEAVRI